MCTEILEAFTASTSHYAGHFLQLSDPESILKEKSPLHKAKSRDVCFLEKHSLLNKQRFHFVPLFTTDLNNTLNSLNVIQENENIWYRYCYLFRMTDTAF